MNNYKLYFAVLLVTLLLSQAAFSQKQTADLVIFNATIRPMDGRKNAESIAIIGNKIVAIGKDKKIRKLIGDNTRTIDARGRLVLPGFNDSHVHFMGIGNLFSSIDLTGLRSPKDIIEKLRYHIQFVPKGRWIVGGRWDDGSWTPDNRLTKQMLDAVAPDNPVFLFNLDPKTALVNSLALKLSGTEKITKIIPGGLVERNAAGETTGIIKDDAVTYVKAFAPVLSTKEYPEIAESASNYAASFGVTSVQDMHSDNLAVVLRDLEKQGKLKTRVYDCIPLPDWQKLAAAGIKRATGEGLVRQGCLKYFSDGDFTVLPEIYDLIKAADQADLQVMVHAIGATANNVILTAIERLIKDDGVKDRRFRSEHAHGVRSEDLPRFAATGTITSMQPHLFRGGVFNGSEPYRTLLGLKTALAFGSDSAVTDMNPLLGIYDAVQKGAGSDDQTISVEQAVYAYTAGSAYAEFQENIKGTLSLGKLADLVILSDDIFEIPTGEIPNAKVVMTIVDGRVVYQTNDVRTDRNRSVIGRPERGS